MAKNKFKKADAPMSKGGVPASDLSPKGQSVAGNNPAKKGFTKSIKAEKRYQPKTVMKG